MRRISCLSIGLFAGALGCGSAATSGGVDNTGGSTGSGSTGTSSGSGSGSGSGSSNQTGSTVGSGSGSSDLSGSSSGSGTSGTSGSTSGSISGTTSGSGSGTGSGSTSGATSGSGSSGSSGSSSGAEGDAGGGTMPCVKGQVKSSEVVMLGDSYMDIGHVGPTIQMVAGATYRTYYLAGAALNYGSGQGNIPYQYEMMAIPANPDIKVVITDGGGNDILINNAQCLSTAVMGDTMCHSVINGSIMRAKTLLAEMAKNGVKDIVFMFYPHINPSVGADANDWLDYAYPLAAGLCCGTAPTGSDLTCQGTASGTNCVFVDTRPEFVGHNMPGANYWFQDGIHPTQPGATAIANKVWAQMQKYCIAQ